MTRKLSIELFQANAHVGNLRANMNQVFDALKTSRAELVVFPECFLTGYPLQDLVLRPGFLAEVDAALDELAQFIRTQGGPALLIGAPIAGADLPHNAAVLIRPDGSRQTAIKIELPNNDVFDERRTFARGSTATPLTFNGWKIGALICEDMWHGPVARELADEGADFLLVINGSPMEMGKQAIRIDHARRRVASTRLPLIYANLVGGQDELVFDGASFALSNDGELVMQQPFEEIRVTLEVTKDEQGKTALVAREAQGLGFKNSTRTFAPVVAYPPKLEAIYRTVTMGLRDYVEKNHFHDVLFGLSGGLDSAVVAAIGADALGGKRVSCLMLPAEWTGEESVSLADDMAQRLGCNYGTVPVKTVTDALEALLDAGLAVLPASDPTGKARQVAAENIQARARGNLIMALSNARPGTLVLSTGNKSEMSVGYATLYGDMCGGFNPIKDLYKTRVQDIAKWRNSLNEADLKRMGLLGVVYPIPEGIITRPPTAELAPGQTDENALGAYPVLDTVLECLIERMLSPAAAARTASQLLGHTVEVDYVERIAKLVKFAEYKRRQAPPGIKVTGRSFGFGWRYPITNAAPL